MMMMMICLQWVSVRPHETAPDMRIVIDDRKFPQNLNVLAEPAHNTLERPDRRRGLTAVPI